MHNPMLELLKSRRSVKPDLLAEPAPSRKELETILTVAARVPDHKKLAPWRFMIIEGEARAKAGEIIAAACAVEDAEPPSAVRLDLERRRLMRAPLVVAIVSRVVETRGAPEWEQVLSAGASAYNLCLAANAMGYATSWLTEWYSYSPSVKAAFGLAENERFVGFVHIGTATQKPDERVRPELKDIVTVWQG
jgi:nitroreductase